MKVLWVQINFRQAKKHETKGEITIHEWDCLFLRHGIVQMEPCLENKRLKYRVLSCVCVGNEVYGGSQRFSVLAAGEQTTFFPFFIWQPSRVLVIPAQDGPDRPHFGESRWRS